MRRRMGYCLMPKPTKRDRRGECFSKRSFKLYPSIEAASADRESWGAPEVAYDIVEVYV